jgi:hypothetical protein
MTNPKVSISPIEDGVMETEPLVSLKKRLSSAASRRGLLAGLAGGLLTTGIIGPGRNDVDAGKRAKRRRKRRKNEKARERVAARCDVPSTQFPTNVGFESTRLAQTFVPGKTGPLVRADLRISKFAESAGDFTLQLSPVGDDGKPTNDVLAETSVPADLVSVDESVISFVFDQPAIVKARTPFALILSSANGGQFVWGADATGSCDGEAFQSPDATAAFDGILDNLDLNFTAIVKA